MTDEVEVHPARLARGADGIRGAVAAIDAVVMGWSSDVGAMGDSWQGAARGAHDTSQRRVAAEFRARTASAMKTCAMLDTLAAEYSDLDLRGARALGAHG